MSEEEQKQNEPIAEVKDVVIENDKTEEVNKTVEETKEENVEAMPQKEEVVNDKKPIDAKIEALNKKKKEDEDRAKREEIQKRKCGGCGKWKSECNCGRPSEMTEYTVKKLEEAFKFDFNITEACLYAKISRETYYNWREADPGFVDKMDSARNFAVMAARRVVVKSINENDKDMSKWFLERKRKDEFSGKSIVEIGDYDEDKKRIIDELGLTDEDFNEENYDETIRRITKHLQGERNMEDRKEA